MPMAPYEEPPLRSAILNGRRQAWRESGEGEALPLMLLHGIGSNARAWAGQFAGFRTQRRVVAWNAPGYAGSAPIEPDWPAPSDYAAALGDLLDHLGIERCVLVGQSLGAVMATAYALDNSDRVAALILVSPASGYAVTAGSELPESVAVRLRELEASGPAGLADARYARLLSAHASPEAHGLVRSAMREVTGRGYRQASHLLAAADLPDAVRSLRVPVATIWGSDDVVTPPQACEAVARATPGARFEVVANAGHAVATERPEAFNQILGRLIIALTSDDRT